MKEGWAKPIRAVFTNTGARYMLLTTFLFAITASLGKINVLRSDPFFASFVTAVLCVIVTAVLMLLKRKKPCMPDKNLFLTGAMNGLENIFFGLAVLYGIVPYVIPMKRLEILIGVVLSAMFLKEKRLGQHLLAVLVMLAGLAIIAVMG